MAAIATAFSLFPKFIPIIIKSPKRTGKRCSPKRLSTLPRKPHYAPKPRTRKPRGTLRTWPHPRRWTMRTMARADRKGDGEGKRGSVRVDLGGGRSLKKKKKR